MKSKNTKEEVVNVYSPKKWNPIGFLAWTHPNPFSTINNQSSCNLSQIRYRESIPNPNLNYIKSTLNNQSKNLSWTRPIPMSTFNHQPSFELS